MPDPLNDPPLNDEQLREALDEFAEEWRKIKYEIIADLTLGDLGERP